VSGSSSDPAGGNSAQSWLGSVTEFQSQALQTRLKIPLLYGIDAVHGHNNIDGAMGEMKIHIESYFHVYEQIPRRSNTVLDQFQQFCSGEEFDAVRSRIAQRLEQACRDKNRHIMRLAVDDLGRLFRRQPGRCLEQWSAGRIARQSGREPVFNAFARSD
jgi:hypothetical protein